MNKTYSNPIDNGETSRKCELSFANTYYNPTLKGEKL